MIVNKNCETCCVTSVFGDRPAPITSWFLPIYDLESLLLNWLHYNTAPLIWRTRHKEKIHEPSSILIFYWLDWFSWRHWSSCVPDLYAIRPYSTRSFCCFLLVVLFMTWDVVRRKRSIRRRSDDANRIKRTVLCWSLRRFMRRPARRHHDEAERTASKIQQKQQQRRTTSGPPFSVCVCAIWTKRTCLLFSFFLYLFCPGRAHSFVLFLLSPPPSTHRIFINEYP